MDEQVRFQVLAKGEDPIAVIERKARDLVLRARDAGWRGPPFNPTAIADLLNISVEANANVADGKLYRRTRACESNSIQLKLASASASQSLTNWHTLFSPMWRTRCGTVVVPTAILMNGSLRSSQPRAAEFVMPIGSLPAREQLPKIEILMSERRHFDVSVEAFLIRVTKIASEPVLMFCASPVADKKGQSNIE